MTKLQYSNGSDAVEFDLNDPVQKAALNGFMGEVVNSYEDSITEIQTQLAISYSCACDVWYLRGRSRHTPELEARLIALHKAGNPPNLMEFGHG